MPILVLGLPPDETRVEDDPQLLTEYVRAGLKRHITHRFSGGCDELLVILLDPKLENKIREGIQHTATGSYVDLEPSEIARIIELLREPIISMAKGVQMPVIQTVMEIRSAVRRLIAPSLPSLYVLSYQELSPDTNIQPVGRISLEGFRPSVGVTAGGKHVWS